MRRALRWLWNVVTLLSLLLLVAMVLLWVRSRTVIDGWYWDGGHGTYDLRAVRSGLGEIQYANERTGYPSVLIPLRHGFASDWGQRSWLRQFGMPYAVSGNTYLWGAVRVVRINVMWLSVTVRDWA